MKKEVRIGRELALIALAYAIIIAVVTWPLSLRLSDAVAGFDGRDSLQWTWFNWWCVKSLLALQSSPTQVSWLYYPQGASHPILQATMFVPLIALPLTLVGGVKLTYNLVFLSSFVLGGVLTYLLLLSLTRNRYAAFVAGVIFVFAPNRVGHALGGHLLLITNWSMLLFALTVSYLLRRPSWRWALIGGVSLAALTLTQPSHLAYFALPFSIVYGGAALFSRRGANRFKRVLPYVGGMLALSILLLLPFYSPLLDATLQGEQGFFTNAGVEEHSTDILAFVLPSPYNPLWNRGENLPALLSSFIKSTRHLEERLAYLGFLPLGLAVWAIARRRQGVYTWLVLALLSATLAMGPSLKVAGNNTELSLPYRWLMDLPFLSWSRTPGRLNETVSLALAVMAALGLADVLSRLRAGGHRAIITVMMVLVIVLDYLVYFPFPVGGQKVPAFYSRLSIEAPAAPLLDMPVSGSRRASNYSLLYQTIHDRPIAGGYIERDPPGTVEWAQFFDRLLSPALADAVVQIPTLEIRREILQRNGIQQVVARRWLMADQGARETLSFIPGLLGEPYYADEDLVAWRVPPSEATLPPYALLVAENGWEAANGGSLVRLKQEGLLFVYAAQAGQATLTVELQEPSARGQQLWVGDFGPISTGEEGLHHRIPLHLQAGLNWLHLRLADCEECQAEFSRISVE